LNISTSSIPADVYQLGDWPLKLTPHKNPPGEGLSVGIAGVFVSQFVQFVGVGDAVGVGCMGVDVDVDVGLGVGDAVNVDVLVGAGVAVGDGPGVADGDMVSVGYGVGPDWLTAGQYPSSSQFLWPVGSVYLT
jgi:hypothetical protein